MNKNNLKLIVRTWFELSNKDESIKKFFDTNEYFIGNEIIKLQEFILSYVGIPEDTSMELPRNDDYYFCRDWHRDQFYMCLDGKISVDELVDLLIEEGEAFIEFHYVKIEEE